MDGNLQEFEKRVEDLEYSGGKNSDYETWEKGSLAEALHDSESLWHGVKSSSHGLESPWHGCVSESDRVFLHNFSDLWEMSAHSWTLFFENCPI